MRVRMAVEPSLVETSDFLCLVFSEIKLLAAGSSISRLKYFHDYFLFQAIFSHLSLSMCLANMDQKLRSCPSFLATKWRFPRMVLRMRELGRTLPRPLRTRFLPLATARQSCTSSELARPDWRMLRWVTSSPAI